MLIRFVPAQLTRRSIDFPSIFYLIKLLVDRWLPAEVGVVAVRHDYGSRWEVVCGRRM